MIKIFWLRRFLLGAVVGVVASSFALDVDAEEERVVGEVAVAAGSTVPVPALEGSATLLGWKLMVKDLSQYELASTCELGVCGELSSNSPAFRAAGRFGAVKLLSKRATEGFEEVDLSSIQGLTIVNKSTFDYVAQIVAVD